MARGFYTLLFYLATPLLLLRLFWRARRQPAYARHIGERFGHYAPRPGGPLLWVHAVSVGETRAAAPLIEALRTRWPDHRILLTGMTPTGREAGAAVFGDRVLQAYLPYDQPGAVDRFLRHFSPAFGILMETEIWPNLLAGAHRHAIPIFLANARLSERSARGYRRIARLIRPAVARLTGVAAQSSADAERLRSLGARDVVVCGNLKFDVRPDPERLALGETWRRAIGDRPVWLAASTREGEEAALLAAWQAVDRGHALLVVVPRHPQRVGEVEALLTRQGWRWSKRSQALPDAQTAIWLGDSMGEMAAYYRLADLAFIGGSLAPLGGQNLIEAAACGCPVLVGPHTFNFLQATEDALAAGAARRIKDATDLIAKVQTLLSQPTERQNMADAAHHFAFAHQGATDKTLAFIAQHWHPAAH